MHVTEEVRADAGQDVCLGRRITVNKQQVRGNAALENYLRLSFTPTPKVVQQTMPPEISDSWPVKLSLCNRGLARLRQNQETATQQDFDRCLALNPNLRQSLEKNRPTTSTQTSEKEMAYVHKQENIDDQSGADGLIGAATRHSGPGSNHANSGSSLGTHRFQRAIGK